MIRIKLKNHRLQNMRRPVARIHRSYGAAQLAQYLVARLCADRVVDNMDDIKSFVELVALQTVEDLGEWIECNPVESVGVSNDIEDVNEENCL